MREESSRTHDVFLSHSSKDKTWADEACSCCRAARPHEPSTRRGWNDVRFPRHSVRWLQHSVGWKRLRGVGASHFLDNGRGCPLSDTSEKWMAPNVPDSSPPWENSGRPVDDDAWQGFNTQERKLADWPRVGWPAPRNSATVPLYADLEIC